MDIIRELSVGSVFQNITFYTFLSLIACLNIDLLLRSSKRNQIDSSIHEIDAN